MKIITGLFVAFLLGLGQGHLLYPVHDGTDRIQVLTNQNLQEVTAAGVTILHVPNGGELDAITDNMLQIAGQVLAANNIKVAKFDVGQDQTTLQAAGLTTGNVYIIRDGVRSVYNGYRSIDTLLSYFRQNTGSLVTVIDGKAQKKAFDATECFRIVGYFVAGSPEYVEYEKAAAALSGDVKFYVVTDPVVAPHLKLAATGEVHVYKPYAKTGEPISTHFKPATAADISTYLSTNQYSALKRINKHNVHALDSLPVDGVHVMAFLRASSAEGYPADKLLKKMVKHGVNTTSTTIYVIDPDEFPIMIDHWQATFNTSLDNPLLGIVNFTDHKSRWVDWQSIQSLNTTEEKYQALHEWLITVENGLFPIDPPPVPDCPCAQLKAEGSQEPCTCSQGCGCQQQAAEQPAAEQPAADQQQVPPQQQATSQQQQATGQQPAGQKATVTGQQLTGKPEL